MSDPIEQLADREYEYGFVTERSRRRAAPRASPRTPCASSPARRTSPSGCSSGGSRPTGASSRCSRGHRAHLGHGPLPEDRLPGHVLLRGSQAEEGAREPRRGRPGAAAHLREARHPAAGAEAPGRRRRGRGLRQRLGGHHLQGGAREAGHHLRLLLGGRAAHPELVRKYLGSVVPYSDNFFACLNSAVFSDGSFAYIPKGVRCPMELSTYFRINAQETGQFERTLIIAEEGAYVSYLEGCTAPCATRTSSTPPWWSWWPSTTPRSSTRRSRTGTRATRTARAASTTSSPSAAPAAAGARRSPGPRWRRAPPSPGSTRAASSRATTPWASSTRWPSRTTTSRRTPAPR